jgi:hypothetical protein
MAKIPLPERGQPLDVTYIYELAQAVNDLSKEVSPATYDYVTIQTADNGPQNRKATEVRVIGALIKVQAVNLLLLENNLTSLILLQESLDSPQL